MAITEEKLASNYVIQALINEIKNRLNLKQNKFQYDELPEATESLLDIIYQYVGDTTSSYINGHFYKCVSDGASTPTYSWQHVVLEELASSTSDGLMSSTMYTKLDSLGLATTSDIDEIFT